jgi:hypothetical protein
MVVVDDDRAGGQLGRQLGRESRDGVMVPGGVVHVDELGVPG